MVKTKGKYNGTVSEIAIILLAIVMIAVFIWILRYEYGKKETATTTQSCVVTDCHNGNGLYVVTVEDRQGNLWDYYSDIPETKGTCVVVTWRGNEIVDAE